MEGENSRSLAQESHTTHGMSLTKSGGRLPENADVQKVGLGGRKEQNNLQTSCIKQKDPINFDDFPEIFA